MKRFACFSISLTLIFLLLPLGASAEALLVPVGEVIGLRLKEDCITVAAFDDALGGNARASGLKIGDRLVAVNEHTVTDADSVRSALHAGEETQLTVQRGSRTIKLKMEPVQTTDGPKLGVYLRQGTAGIGTVTWYDPASKTFGALGHGVNDSRGCLMRMTDGEAFPAQVSAVVRGKCGQPGQLKGIADNDDPFAILYRNTPQGIFGKTRSGWKGEPVATASAEQVHTGDAAILSTIFGASPEEYEVQIIRLYPCDRKDGRNFMLKVTDPELLNATGGIVQGMSGSPILQDGRLIGAVTHVLVNDPTLGYGIFIGNMLEAAA